MSCPDYTCNILINTRLNNLRKTPVSAIGTKVIVEAISAIEGTTGIAIVVGTTKDVEDCGEQGQGKREGVSRKSYQEGHPKKLLKPKRRGEGNTVQELPTKPIQELVDGVNHHIAQTTLDYALVTVMDNSHLVVDLGSLRGAQSLTEPKFMSHVKWLQGAATMKATLYNGSCCVTYMQEHLPLVKVLNQDELTALTLANRLSYVMHAPHEDAFKKANQIVKEDGVWLNHVDCAFIETNLAGNQLLPIYLDSENDFFNMMMNVLLQMPLVQSQHKYMDTTLSMVKLFMLHAVRQAIYMLDFLTSPVDFQDMSKDVPEGSHIPAAFKPEYLCLAVLDDKFFMDWTDQYLDHFHKGNGVNMMEYFASSTPKEKKIYCHQL
ncbi:hypothetical protein BKA83DRAFT_4131524 [Pisolithus microcarpus]|nr:hypothetical protein BKA83DRAFT_4131524 [Pisolithus microcarpus]